MAATNQARPCGTRCNCSLSLPCWLLQDSVSITGSGRRQSYARHQMVNALPSEQVLPSNKHRSYTLLVKQTAAILSEDRKHEHLPSILSSTTIGYLRNHTRGERLRSVVVNSFPQCILTHHLGYVCSQPRLAALVACPNKGIALRKLT